MRTIYSTISRLGTSQPIKEKKRTGRPSTWTAATRKSLKRFTNNRTGTSQRRLGKKFNVHHTTVGRQLSKMNVRYRKRGNTQKYNQRQRETAKSRILLQHLRDLKCLVVMDDEKYFIFAGLHMPGNAGYYTDNQDTCPESVRFAGMLKYPPKLLVWIAFLNVECPNHISGVKVQKQSIRTSTFITA